MNTKNNPQFKTQDDTYSNTYGNTSKNAAAWDAVLKYFMEITQIPRCSGHEEQISHYLVKFARDHGLEALQDRALNVIIKKKAACGYENSPAVILQGHMDMVCIKDEGMAFDFARDPILCVREGNYLQARGTTLGADNGIALAYCLALLEADGIPHPPLEVVFTTGEEIGLTGVAELDAGSLKGSRLINLDMEGEGKLLVSCAGGVTCTVRLPVEWEDRDQGTLPYTVSIRGLNGGHSGMEIHRGRANAIKLMGQLLHGLKDALPGFSLHEIGGGNRVNAIPTAANAVVSIPQGEEKRLEDKINEWYVVVRNVYGITDPEMTVALALAGNGSGKVLTSGCFQKLLALLLLLPNGVQTMSPAVEGLVQSSNNVGLIKTWRDEIEVVNCLRSSVASLKEDLLRQVEVLADLLGARTVQAGDYPAWQYRQDSHLREVCARVYENIYGRKPEIFAIHAGVECGWFKEKIGDIDMISIGPDLYDVHTTRERLDLPSARRTFDYLLAVLKELR